MICTLYFITFRGCLMEILKNKNLKYSLYDGVFATIFANLTGGMFLTGFALYLGMNEFLIGLLASIPFAATFLQLPASLFIAKRGERKRIACLNAAVARLMWVFILIAAILPIQSLTARLAIVLGLFILSHSFIAISYVSWLSWISDLVPDGHLGDFFGTRNMLNGIAGMVAIIVFGHLLSFAKLNFPGGLTTGFSFTIVTAVIAGLMSLFFLNRISELPEEKSAGYPSLRENLLRPLKEANYRKLLLYSVCWNFSVNFAAPFVTLYMLRDLTLSLSFVSTLAMISTASDLTGMKLWGKISDRIKNKAIIQVSSWVAVFLPFLWAFVRPGDILMPIFLHILGGGFWAGIQLCTNNLILRISPRQQRPLFISAHNITAGLGAAISPIFAGLILKLLSSTHILFISEKILPLQFIFIISTALRFFSLQLLRKVHEPEEVTVGQFIRILRNVRGLNTSNGFNPLLHPFVAVGKTDGDRDSQLKTSEETQGQKDSLT